MTSLKMSTQLRPVRAEVLSGSAAKPISASAGKPDSKSAAKADVTAGTASVTAQMAPITPHNSLSPVDALFLDTAIASRAASRELDLLACGLTAEEVDELAELELRHKAGNKVLQH